MLKVSKPPMYCDCMEKIIESKMTYLESESESESLTQRQILTLTLTVTQILVQC